MNKWCIALLVTLLLSVCIGLGILLWQRSIFHERDAARVVQIEKALVKAEEQAQKVEDLKGAVGVLEEQKKAVEGDLEALRAKWKARPRVRKSPEPTVEEEDCQEALATAEELIPRLEDRLLLEVKTGETLAEALFESEGRADQLEKAWTLERERTKDFKKQQRRDKIGKVFIGLGAGIAGGAVGFTVGTLR